MLTMADANIRRLSPNDNSPLGQVLCLTEPEESLGLNLCRDQRLKIAVVAGTAHATVSMLYTRVTVD